MYILSRSFSPSCLVSSRLVSFHFSIPPHPLARQCVSKSVSMRIRPSTYHISYNRPSSRFLAFPFQEDPTKRKEREDLSCSRVCAIDQIFHTPRPARFDRVPQTRELAPIFQYLFVPIVFSSPSPSPSLSPLSFFLCFILCFHHDRSDREIRCIRRQNHRPKGEGCNPIGNPSIA